MPIRPAADVKSCAACGRVITWRRKWQRDWENVKYCSDSCRRRGVNDVDRTLEQAILELLGTRSASASICPSEAARHVDPVEWRRLMEPARRAARRLAVEGKVRITQRGRPVDPTDFSGPIRVQLET